MFENFDEFKDDFMSKIGNDLPWQTEYNSDKIIIKQSKETSYRTYDNDWNDSWHDTYNEWETDFGSLRQEIIEAVSYYYLTNKLSSNRFIKTKSYNTDWITNIDEDSYNDYYDAGLTQTFTIYLDKLFDMIQTHKFQ